MKTKIIQNIKSVIIISLLVVGVSYVSANWTAPISSPPTCTAGTPGCDAPINAGSTAQTRTGDLTLQGILTSLHLFTSDLTVTNSDGTVTSIPDGAPLVANGANTGKVKWGAVTSTGGSGSSPVTVVQTTTIPAATVMTVPNPQGTLPNFVRWLAVNDVADQGYSPGDQAEIINDQTYSNSAWNAPQGQWETSTQLGYSSDGQLFSNALEVAKRDGSGNWIDVDSAKWHVKVVAQW